MSYVIRDKEGFAKLIVPNDDASVMISKVTGSFKERRFKNLGTKTIFEVERGGSLTYGNLVICLNELDYFVSQ